LTKKAGEKVKGEREKGGKAPLLHAFLAPGFSYGEEEKVCAETAGAKAQGVRFQAPRFIYGVSLSLSPFPCALGALIDLCLNPRAINNKSP